MPYKDVQASVINYIKRLEQSACGDVKPCFIVGGGGWDGKGFPAQRQKGFDGHILEDMTHQATQQITDLVIPQSGEHTC